MSKMTYPHPYPKGKDIKVPFDCLWHYYTRKFNADRRMNVYDTDPNFNYWNDKPEDFEKW